MPSLGDMSETRSPSHWMDRQSRQTFAHFQMSSLPHTDTPQIQTWSDTDIQMVCVCWHFWGDERIHILDRMSRFWGCVRLDPPSSHYGFAFLCCSKSCERLVACATEIISLNRRFCSFTAFQVVLNIYKFVIAGTEHQNYPANSL